MEQQTTSSLFNLSIDPLTKSHLTETAKWARFLSIVGMVSLVLMVLFGLFFSTFLSSMSRNSFDGEPAAGWSSAIGVGMAIVYIVIAIIWFFPLFFLLRFSNTLKTALNSNDQAALNVSFQNLKASFRYVGIFTLIILALYALLIVFQLVGGASNAF